jgi:hypothetical protein
MSQDDVLERAVRAAREVCNHPATECAASRDVILAAAFEKRQRTRRTTIIVMPLLATMFTASSVLAAATGRLQPMAWWHAVVDALPTHRSAAHPALHPSAVISQRAPISPTQLTPSRETEPVSVVLPNIPLASAPSADPLPFAPPETEPRRASPDTDSALYSAAHRTHFNRRDPVAALRAWDAYLRAMPYGRYVPEARYNRALDLIRLGRIDEARTALQPFLGEDFGGYRRREAQQLIDALGPRTP